MCSCWKKSHKHDCKWIRVLWRTEPSDVPEANCCSRPAPTWTGFIALVNRLLASHWSAFGADVWSHSVCVPAPYVCVCDSFSCILQPDKLCDCDRSTRAALEFNAASTLHSAPTIQTKLWQITACATHAHTQAHRCKTHTGPHKKPADVQQKSCKYSANIPSIGETK